MAVPSRLLIEHPPHILTALHRRTDWIQLTKFCLVGASGYIVNLAVYRTLIEGGVSYLAAACVSFFVAVTNNYVWNRVWTFRAQRGSVAYQGGRFLAVSIGALALNLLALRGLVGIGIAKLPAQALAILLVTPLNFLGNKLWSFR